MTEQTPPDIVPVNVLFFYNLPSQHYVVRFVMYRYKANTYHTMRIRSVFTPTGRGVFHLDYIELVPIEIGTRRIW